MKTKTLVFIIALFNVSLLHAQWVTDGGNTTTNDHVGIGTSTPSAELEIYQGRIQVTPDPDDDIGLSIVPQIGTRVDFRPFVNSSNSLYFDTNLRTLTNTSNAVVRFFRQTNTSGIRRVDFMRGNGSAYPVARISVDDNDSFINRYGGNVGIGTTSPEDKLEVNGDLRLSAGSGITPRKLRFYSGGDMTAYIGKSSNDLMLSNDEEDGDIRFRTHLNGSSSTRMILKSDGKVGIGTHNPTDQLHVDGHLRVDGELKLKSPNNSTMRLLVDNTGDLKLQRDHGNIAMTINDENGKIGIGTQSPSARLEIRHDSEFSTPHLELVETDASETSKIFMKNAGSTNFFAVTANPGATHPYLNFSFNNGSYTNTVMIIDGDNHRVGIGNDISEVPAGYRLAVDGKVRCREVRVTNSGWADFVFEKDYDLPTLEEVESYIQNNKHLPDVPSAAEVLENGTDLGEIDAILLQKIEELTLYIIDLNKEIEELKKNNAKQDQN